MDGSMDGSAGRSAFGAGGHPGAAAARRATGDPPPVLARTPHSAVPVSGRGRWPDVARVGGFEDDAPPGAPR